jgi:hypothetical protein
VVCRRGTKQGGWHRSALRARSISAAALAVVLVGSVFLGSAAGSRTGKRFLGVTYPPYPMQVIPEKSDLDKMGRAGVSWVRWPFLWRMIEPHRDAFDWSIPDKVIARFASRGISVLPEVYGSADFAKRSSARPPLRPASARREWKEFLRASAERYGPDGTFWSESVEAIPSRYHDICDCSDPSRPIKSWQIWNEPNLKSYFRPRPSARRYAALVRMSRRALTSVDPHAKLILAGLTSAGEQTSVQFLNRLYRTGHGIKRQFDAVALNPYSARVSSLRTQLGRARRSMRRHHDRRTPLWITELGWSSSRAPSPYKLNKGPRGQKRLLKRSFRMIRRHRRQWHVRRLMWFHWRDPDRTVPSGCGFCAHAGLIRHSGKPKPAFRAYRRIARANRNPRARHR